MKKSSTARVAAVCLLMGGMKAAWAAEPVKVSSDDILNILIQQGVIDEKKKDEVIRRAKERTRQQYQSGVETVPASKADVSPPGDPSVVRVPYVPQYIKDDICDKVRTDLREDVVDDVMKKAEQERWGIPGTAPDWTQRIKFSGDVRLRGESVMFAEGNEPQTYKNYNVVNKEGGTNAAGPDAYYNTTEDRARLRTRMRVGMKANVTTGVEAGMRLATANSSNPVSTNETLGDYGKSFDLQMDRAYLKYTSFAKDIMLVGGRFENPFLVTDLIWDSDLQFDGIAGSYYWLRDSGWESEDRQWDPFVRAGLFPVDEFELSDDDKWLIGGQVGFEYHTWEQDVFRLGVGYYHYKNMPGTKNAVDDVTFDFTAPDSFQKGNTVFNIHNSSDPSAEDELFALAFDYHIADILIQYDMATFSPYHIVLTAEYIENVGADEDEALARAFPSGAIADEDAAAVATSKDGYLVKAMFGWPIMAKPGDWQVALSYRELGADAAIDAFADSDFHLGGTDSRGYVFEGSYGLLNEVWMTAKWMSSNEIDEATLGVDILQIDLNARF